MANDQELSSAKYFTSEVAIESLRAEVATVTSEATSNSGTSGFEFLSKLIGVSLMFCGVAAAGMYWYETGPAKRQVTSNDPVEHFLNHPMFRIVNGMGGIDHEEAVAKHRKRQNQWKDDLERKLRDSQVIKPEFHKITW